MHTRGHKSGGKTGKGLWVQEGHEGKQPSGQTLQGAPERLSAASTQMKGPSREGHKVVGLSITSQSLCR